MGRRDRAAERLLRPWPAASCRTARPGCAAAGRRAALPLVREA